VILPKVKPQRLKPKAGRAIILRKGGEKDEENQNQTFIQKGSDGKESEPSQADEKVDRADQNGWYPKNFRGIPEVFGIPPKKIHPSKHRIFPGVASNVSQKFQEICEGKHCYVIA